MIRKLAIFFIVVLFALAIIVFGLKYMDATKDYTVIPYDLQIKVGGYAGFNTARDKIYFGTVPPGSTGQRNFTLNHTYSVPVKVNFTVEGDLAGWITISEVNFLLEPAKKKEIEIKATPPMNQPYGTYTGKLYANFYFLKEGEIPEMPKNPQTNL